MKSKEYSDLRDSIGHLIDVVGELDQTIDDLDESKTDEYREAMKKIDGIYADVEEVKRDLDFMD